MPKASKKDDLGEGVFFARDACAGLSTRLLILVIDIVTLLFFGFALGLIWYYLVPIMGNPNRAVFSSWLAVSYFYLVIIESWVGTLGFYLTGVKVLDLKGGKPSIVRMTFRLLLWILGPFNPLIDLYWVTNDRHKQTLRDKLAGTYVIKKCSIPSGKGRVHAVHYFLFGFSILFPEVREQRA
jgi:uncharacterized RDD family membrane protein YckC